MLIAAICLTFFSLTGLGLSLLPEKAKTWPLASLFYCALGFGLLGNLALVLTGLNLALCNALVFALAIFGWWRYAKIRRIGDDLAALSWPMLALSGLLCLMIVSRPIVAWDARSIWFFHAKILYFQQQLEIEPFWLSSSFAFAHLDYPKLMSGLAAQIMTLFGVWNEYLPKSALTLQLFVVLLGLQPVVVGLPRKIATFGAALLIAACWLIPKLRAPGLMIWEGFASGYQDFYLALFAALALYYVKRCELNPDSESLWPAFASIGLLANTKNEGQVIALIIALVFLGTNLRSLTNVGRRLGSLVWLPLLAAGLPTICWTMLKKSQAVTNDLASDGLGLQRLLHRLPDTDSWQLISKSLFLGSPHAALTTLLLVVFAAVWIGRNRLAKNDFSGQVVLVSIIYLATLYIIYLSTPADLAWHLETSAYRTILPVWAMLTLRLASMPGMPLVRLAKDAWPNPTRELSSRY